MKRRKQRDERKEALDRDTSYLTLLPTMGEGYHAGYQPKAGVVSDQNLKPNEWLESVARNMLTDGEDVGFAIPDVLAGEAQLRRLMRLPQAEALHRQELIDWRAALAVLLLWDAHGDHGLQCENLLEGDGGAFRDSVRAALSRERAAFGLWLFTLETERDGVVERRPLGMLSPTVALTPAANMGDLSAVLPRWVRWYDRERRRFMEPCLCMDEADRSLLVYRLKALRQLNERAELDSPLYSPDAPLCGLIDRFCADLTAQREAYRSRLELLDSEAETELYVRALAVYGLGEQLKLAGLSREECPLTAKGLRDNPLLSRLTPAGASVELGDDSVLLVYKWRGTAFALQSPLTLLDPAGTENERELLRSLAREESLPSQYLGDWNQELARRFLDLANRLTGHHGASRRVIGLLRTWSAEHAAYREAGDCMVPLFLPDENIPATLDVLAQRAGLPNAALLTEAFSDCLLLCDGGSPFDDADVDERCIVYGADGLFAVPPIGPTPALFLTRAADEADDELTRPYIAQDSLRFEAFEDDEGRKVRASFRLICPRRERGALIAVTFALQRVYRMQAELEQGAAVILRAAQLPTVAVWPNVRLKKGGWQSYWVYAHAPEPVELWAVDDSGEPVQGDYRFADDSRRWQALRTRRFPLLPMLRRGSLSLGALMNEQSPRQLKRDDPACIAIDFGSNATGVMLRQGGRVRAATLPDGTLRTLLQGRAADDAALAEEFVPRDWLADAGDRPSVFRSAMDLFTDDDAKWREPLLDGHIYAPPTLQALLAKSAGALYYDLKWSDEPYRVRIVRLFLKQTMLQAALSARLGGAPSVSWRVSMPTALPLYRRAAYLELMRGLAREVSDETGLPLTQGIPSVLFADENVADGLYFRDRNEVNAKGGYLNMDVGGGTTDLSVWLGGDSRPVAEASLLMGCRAILFESLTERHRTEFEADFADGDAELRALVHELTQAFAASENAVRGHEKSLFLLDAFVGEHSEDIARMMAQVRAQGRVSLLESLLLLNFGFLFRLCGALLDSCAESADTRARLKPRMELCVAGNGGRFLQCFDDDARAKLFGLAMASLRDEHPVRELLLVQSRHPKLEVAMGLLADDAAMQSSVHGEELADERPAPAFGGSALLKDYLSAFYAAFPQAGEKLLGKAFARAADGRSVVWKPAAEMELATVADNETSADATLSAQVRAFGALKRLWRI